MKDYTFMEKEKKRLGTPRIEIISRLIQEYVSEGKNGFESSTGKILKGI